MQGLIYLDYNATTPVDPRVLDRMLPWFTDRFGNPASAAHAGGWEADAAVKRAREQVAALIGATPDEIVFTSGATEAINLAIKGVAATHSARGRHIVTVATEHSAVLETVGTLEHEGFEVTRLPVDASGRLDPDLFERNLRSDTILAAVMWANNETGVIHPVRDLAEVAHRHEVTFLTDATQAVGKVPVSVQGVDLLACSGHKFYAPKGVGVLYRRAGARKIRLKPLIDGGGQEGGLRGGTLNVPAIVGIGEAAELASQQASSDARRLEAWRDTLESELTALDGVAVNGAGSERLPQTSNLRIRSIRAADLMARIRALALSAGSACSSGTGKPSHVLTAMGLPAKDALSSIRISLGRFTTEEEVNEARTLLREAIATSLP